MRENLLLIANSAGIVASVFGYGLAVWQWNRELSKSSRRPLWKLIILSIVATMLLVLLSLRLKYNIDTLEQTGSLRSYRGGSIQVYYPIPYRSPPKLEFLQEIKADRSTAGPRILEQRSDGFQIELDLDSWLYTWKATGIQSP